MSKSNKSKNRSFNPSISTRVPISKRAHKEAKRMVQKRSKVLLENWDSIPEVKIG